MPRELLPGPYLVGWPTRLHMESIRDDSFDGTARNRACTMHPRPARSTRPFFGPALIASMLVALGPWLPPGQIARAEVASRGLSMSGLSELLRNTRADLEVESLFLQRSVAPLLSSALAAVPSDLSFPMRQVVERDFNADRMSQRLHELLAVRSKRKHVQSLLAFYRTPLGRRYAHAPRVARPGVPSAETKAMGGARTRLVRDWVDASLTLKRFETKIVLPAWGLARSLTALGHPQQTTREELAVPMRSKELQTAVVAHFANSFKGFTDAELAALVRLERSAAGVWYRRAELDALTQTLEEAFRALENEAEAVRTRMHQRYGSSRKLRRDGAAPPSPPPSEP